MQVVTKTRTNTLLSLLLFCCNELHLTNALTTAKWLFQMFSLLKINHTFSQFLRTNG